MCVIMCQVAVTVVQQPMMVGCCNVCDYVSGGCHSGAPANDGRMSHRGTHQTASPNGFVSD